MPVSPENSERRHEHVRIDAVRVTKTYIYPSQGIKKPPLRGDHQAHAATLKDQLADALRAMPEPGTATDIAELPKGVLINVKTEVLDTPTGRPGGLSKLSRGLESLGSGVVQLRTERNDDQTEKAVVFVTPDGGNRLRQGVEQYAGTDRTGDETRFRNVGTFGPTDVSSLFVGAVDFELPERQWWEIWTRKAYSEQLQAYFQRVDGGLDISADKLEFPDATVLFIHGSAAELAVQLSRVLGAVFEVRHSVNSIGMLLGADEPSQNPADWTDDLAARLDPPDEGAPVVCVLDTGVSAAHPLIQPGLVQALAYNAAWGAGDGYHNDGHGTPLCGLALHGNLQPLLESASPMVLTHGLESVNFIPPAGVAVTEEKNLGVVTQGAVALAEIGAPDTNRSFCIASSSPVFAPDGPSSWSGAVDQICSGSMTGDGADTPAADLPKRLVVLAAGNMHGGTRAQVSELKSIENPAQAWNALTIGGFTEFDNDPMDPPGHFTAVVPANHRSPFSTGTVGLPGDLTPIKPEVCFEAGNMVADPSDDCDWHPETSLLSTGRDVMHAPLAPFWATSAAVGIAANFNGQLQAALPAVWPETIRALMVDSARWKKPVRDLVLGSGKSWKGQKGGVTITKADRQRFLREHGYGVPEIGRAKASARNALTLVAEAEIQPFALNEEGTRVGFNELHLYPLPWPRARLDALGEGVVTMRVTLSYFIEPNLTGRAATRPDTYRSFGLRFAMKKRADDQDNFINGLTGVKAEPPAEGEETEQKKTPGEGGNWFLGPKAINAGSLHCDLWRGPAHDLALHDMIAVHPTSGWWKTHKGQHRYNDRGRYALVVSISADEHDVDLLTEVEVELAAAIQQPLTVDV